LERATRLELATFSLGIKIFDPLFSIPHESSLHIANVNRQLQCFRAGQHVTERPDLYKPIFGQPLTLLDHVVVHRGDLRDWPTYIHKAEKQKVEKHLSPGRHLVFISNWRFAFHAMAFYSIEMYLIIPG
jgi:hypothetical protein